MWSQLDDLNLGCHGGGGHNISDVFARAGVAVATNLGDGTTSNAEIYTGRRQTDTCVMANETIDYVRRRLRRSPREDWQMMTEITNAGIRTTLYESKHIGLVKIK